MIHWSTYYFLSASKDQKVSDVYSACLAFIVFILHFIINGVSAGNVIGFYNFKTFVLMHRYADRSLAVETTLSFCKFFDILQVRRAVFGASKCNNVFLNRNHSSPRHIFAVLTEWDRERSL